MSNLPAFLQLPFDREIIHLAPSGWLTLERVPREGHGPHHVVGPARGHPGGGAAEDHRGEPANLERIFQSPSVTTFLAPLLSGARSAVPQKYPAPKNFLISRRLSQALKKKGFFFLSPPLIIGLSHFFFQFSLRLVGGFLPCPPAVRAETEGRLFSPHPRVPAPADPGSAQPRPPIGRRRGGGPRRDWPLGGGRPPLTGVEGKKPGRPPTTTGRIKSCVSEFDEKKNQIGQQDCNLLR